MATTTTLPTPETASLPKLEVRKQVFDLDSKETVTLVKQSDPPAPIASMEDFVSRLGNDAAAILKIVNDGYVAYVEKQLASDETKPWLLEDEDEAGNPTLEEYKGTPISNDKAKQLSATVINIAKLMFGYAKNMVAGNVEENRKAKSAAKAQALQMVLSNPAAVEALRK